MLFLHGYNNYFLLFQFDSTFITIIFSFCWLVPSCRVTCGLFFMLASSSMDHYPYQYYAPGINYVVFLCYMEPLLVNCITVRVLEEFVVKSGALLSLGKNGLWLPRRVAGTGFFPFPLKKSTLCVLIQFPPLVSCISNCYGPR